MPTRTAIGNLLDETRRLARLVIVVRGGLPHRAGQSAAHPQHSWEGVIVGLWAHNRRIVGFRQRLFPLPTTLTRRKTRPYPAAPQHWQPEVDVSDQAKSGACDVPTAIDRLSRAVQHLEAALAARERAVAEEAIRMQTMRAEAEALRALQQTVAVRLDAAIARLKDAIGD
jgi:hypothetical protein